MGLVDPDRSCGLMVEVVLGPRDGGFMARKIPLVAKTGSDEMNKMKSSDDSHRPPSPLRCDSVTRLGAPTCPRSGCRSWQCKTCISPHLAGAAWQ